MQNRKRRYVIHVGRFGLISQLITFFEIEIKIKKLKVGKVNVKNQLNNTLKTEIQYSIEK